MRWLRLVIIFLLAIFALYSVIWFAGAIVVNRQADRQIERLDKQSGVSIQAAERGLAGWLRFAAKYRLADATIRMNQGAIPPQLTIQGTTAVGVDLIDPLTVRAMVPAGGEVSSAMVNGVLGQIDVAARTTLDPGVRSVTATLDQFNGVLLGLQKLAVSDIKFAYHSAQRGETGPGRVEFQAKLSDLAVPQFIKNLLLNRMPNTGLHIPDGDQDLGIDATLYPSGPVLTRAPDLLMDWISDGGHVAVHLITLPFHEALETPKKALVFGTSGGSIDAVVCEHGCRGEACQPAFTIRNLTLTTNSSVEGMSLPGDFAGMSGPEICQAL